MKTSRDLKPILLLLICLAMPLPAKMLVLKQAPVPIILKKFCFSSLLAEPETGCISWNRHESAGPLFSDGLIYVGGSDAQLHVILASNKQTQKRVSLPAALHAKPTIQGSQLLLGTNQGHVVSLNTKTWKQNWLQKLDAELLNPILVSRQRVYALSGLSTLYALDSHSGQIIWKQKRFLETGLGLQAQSNPLILEGIIP